MEIHPSIQIIEDCEIALIWFFSFSVFVFFVFLFFVFFNTDNYIVINIEQGDHEYAQEITVFWTYLEKIKLNNSSVSIMITHFFSQQPIAYINAI